MDYHIQEGSFSLDSSDWLDCSMNILRNDAEGISVVVSRGIIPAGSDFEQEFLHQWDSMRPQMVNLQQSPFTSLQIGPLANIPAIEVTSHFESDQQTLYQQQLALDAQGSLLVFTYSATRPFNDSDVERWLQLKSSLIFNATE
jgi:hypothetical protein